MRLSETGAQRCADHGAVLIWRQDAQRKQKEVTKG